MQFDLIEDFHSAKQFLAPICLLDTPVDDLEDRFR